MPPDPGDQDERARQGARGLTGVRAFLGGVSNHVLQHARRPVLVVPPTAVPSDPKARADATRSEVVAG